MTKRRTLCASFVLLLGLTACSSGPIGTGEPTPITNEASPAASGVVNPAAPAASDATGYVAPNQAPAVAPAITADPAYPAPSASP